MDLATTLQTDLASEASPTLQISEAEVAPLGVILPVVILSLLTFASFVSNIGVIVIVLKTPHLRNNLTYVFVLNLCFIDLLATTTVMPVAILSSVRDMWSLRQSLCEVHGFWTYTLIYASIFSACSISVERYYSIRAPMHYSANLTFSIVIGVIVLLWILSVCIALLPIAGWSAYVYNQYQNICTFTSLQSQSERSFVIFEFVFCFLLPTIIIISMYGGIYRVAKHTSTQIRPFCSHKADGRSCLSSNVCTSLPTTSGCGSGTTSGSSQSAISRGGSDVGPMNQCWLATGSLSAIPNSVEPPMEPPISVIDPDTENHQKVNVQITFDHCQSSLEQPICSNTGSLEGVHRKTNTHWKAAKTLTCISATFILLWSPFFTMTLCHKSGVEVTHLEILFPISTWLAFASFAINPIIYGLLNRTIREALYATYEQVKAQLLGRRREEEETLGDEDFFQFLERTSTTRTNSSSKRSSLKFANNPGTLVEESESSYEHSSAFP